jgi:hypothetical protein
MALRTVASTRVNDPGAMEGDALQRDTASGASTTPP